MSQDSKRIKVTTIVTLLYGLASIVAGIALLVVDDQTAASVFALLSGVVSVVLGVRGALIANVPSNTQQLVKLSGCVFVVQLAFSGATVAIVGPSEVNEDPVGLCFILVGALLALIVLILSHRLKKALDAK